MLISLSVVALASAAAGSPQGAVPTMYPPNDPNVYYSPFAWAVNATSAATINSYVNTHHAMHMEHTHHACISGLSTPCHALLHVLHATHAHRSIEAAIPPTSQTFLSHVACHTLVVDVAVSECHRGQCGCESL